MLLKQRFPPDIRVENEAASLIGAGHDVHLLCTEDARRSTELPATLRRLVVHTVTSRASLVRLETPRPESPSPVVLRCSLGS